ncbi:hypothetical protein M8J77_021620 [Diaphorina citri]|nr:hypothetical protein M8J77_021620 [Diaphorina citri]
MDTLRSLGFCVDIANQHLKNHSTTINLQLRDSNTEVNKIEIYPESEQVIELKVSNIKNGEAMLPAVNLGSCSIQQGVVEVRNGKALCTVTNPTVQKLNLCYNPLTLEELHKNYDFKVTDSNLNNFSSPTKFNFNLIRTQHMNEEEKFMLENLLKEFEEVFHMEGNPLTFTNKIKHKINTTNEDPIYTKPYRYPAVHREEVRAQINKMLEENIIRPSHSPWSSPIWVVPKKLDSSGRRKWRIVIDYRKLNDKTVNDRYPLPNITDLLDKLGRCVYFTTLDLASGFYQIEMDENSIQKTAFNTEGGHYEYLRMPMGLKNSPSTFQRVMDDVLRGLVNECCLVYLDDIIIFGSSLQQHLQNIRKVLTRLRDSNLKIQLDKSEFLRKEVEYLGHVVTEEGVKPNPTKINAIKSYPIPRTVKQIKGFLGLLGYYRRFIKDFARLTKPLTKCLKKDAKIDITDVEYKDCFEKCKIILANEPVLQYPDFSKPFILTTDASNVALGAVLSQGVLGQDKPIAFASRTLNDSERNYSTIEKELLGVVWAVKYFRPYLFGRHYKIVTDHKPLQWLFSLKDPSSKLVRWRLKLEEFDYEVLYKKGSLNKNADALSRIELNINEGEPQPSTSGTQAYNDDLQSIIPEVDISDLSIDFDALIGNMAFNDLITEDGGGEDTNATVHSSEQNPTVGIPISETPVNQAANQIIISTVPHSKANVTFRNNIHGNKMRYLVQLDSHKSGLDIQEFINEYIAPNVPYHLYFEDDPQGKLYELISVVLQNHYQNSNLKFTKCTKYLRDIEEDHEKENIVTYFHEGMANHRGMDEVEKTIKLTYYWPNIRKTVQNVINKCEICQLSKYDRNPLKPKFNITPTAVRPFQIVHIDCISLENTKCLSIVDSFSKYAQMYPIDSAQAVEVAQKLLQYFTHHGVPETIISDNGGEFHNGVIKELLELHKVNLHFISSQHPESNGIVERFHSTIIEHIRLLNNRREFKEDSIKTKICYAILAYNNTIHSTTNMKPVEIVNGHLCSTNPFDIDLEKQILTNYVSAHKEKTKLIFGSVNTALQAYKENNISRANRNREDPPQIPSEVFVRDRQKQNKTKNKYKKETITTVNTQNKTATIAPTHHNTVQKIHMANIKRPKRACVRPVADISGSPSSDNPDDPTF